jgi:hypothetical protein
MLNHPARVKVLDSQLGVLADRARADVRAEARVVVDGVVGEVRRDLVRVASVKGLVIAPDVLQLAQSP